MNLVVYTAVFGNYDALKPISRPVREGIDFICFTNIKDLSVKGWKVIYVESVIQDNVLSNRKYKMFPHKFLKEYEYSVYIDANVRVIENLSELVRKYMRLGVLACPKHPSRSCLYDEAQEVIQRGKASEFEVKRQLNAYSADNFPQNHGLHEMNVIIRKHNDFNVIKVMEEWWKQFNKFSKRDQLSFHYALWKTAQPVVDMSENTRQVNKYYYTDTHKNDGCFIKLKRKVNVMYQLYIKKEKGYK